MKLRIKATAQTDANIYDCNGISDDTEFMDYFWSNDPEIEDSISRIVSGGLMSFAVKNNTLWTYTDYEVTEKLNSSEMKALQDYTQGQWSDGIGEGFEQQPCGSDKYGDEIYISPWHRGQVLSFEYI